MSMLLSGSIHTAASCPTGTAHLFPHRLPVFLL